MKNATPRDLSRRRFLRHTTMGAGAVAAGLYLPSGLTATGLSMVDGSSGRDNVLVLGAGLAGLAAAWELEEAGHEVTVLEARTRPGGRVLTLRDPFADGLHVEAGAVAFSEAYPIAHRYIDVLGLERAEWAVPDLRQLFHLRGRRFSVAPDEPVDWPYDLTEEERRLGPMGIVERYVMDPLPPEIADPDAWREPPLAGLDGTTLREFMREQGASAEAVELVRDTQWFGNLMDRVSMLSVAVSFLGTFMAGAPFVLAGGNDRLPRAMANRLSRSIRYGRRVVTVRQDEEGVRVTAHRNGQTETYRADRAVCTIPATVLRGYVEFEPELPDDKRRAVMDVPYDRVTRTFLQVRRGFWHDEGVTGAAIADLPVSRVDRHPYSDPGGPDRRAVLESFVDGPDAAGLAAQPDDEVVARTLRHMEEIHPEIRKYREGGLVKAWSRDPFALGAWSSPRPGDVTRHLEAMQRPHGRVHFAGEHTSVLFATMEGALRSGVRAAREVAEADREVARADQAAAIP